MNNDTKTYTTESLPGWLPYAIPYDQSPKPCPCCGRCPTCGHTPNAAPKWNYGWIGDPPKWADPNYNPLPRMTCNNSDPSVSK